MQKILLTFLILLFVTEVSGQFAPQAGLSGSTAIPASSTLIKDWAHYITIDRGYINAADTTLTVDSSNRATYGDKTAALGPADGKVISLGDGGSATIFIPQGIYNGPGYDFVVFENGFRSTTDSNLAFLELAFVEVSNDGKNFVRFPAISLTQDTVQIGSFGWLDARKIYNLAGKYIGGYGVPFDLGELSSQEIDLNNIHYIRITDVIGTINPYLASYDSQGHIINDPFPTPFPSCGFDLDAVGLININHPAQIKIFPIPTKGLINIISGKNILQILIIDNQGKIKYKSQPNVKFFKINLSQIQSGLYFCIIKTKNQTFCRKLIKI